MSEDIWDLPPGRERPQRDWLEGTCVPFSKKRKRKSAGFCLEVNWPPRGLQALVLEGEPGRQDTSSGHCSVVGKRDPKDKILFFAQRTISACELVVVEG